MSSYQEHLYTLIQETWIYLFQEMGHKIPKKKIASLPKSLVPQEVRQLPPIEKNLSLPEKREVPQAETSPVMRPPAPSSMQIKEKEPEQLYEDIAAFIKAKFPHVKTAKFQPSMSDVILIADKQDPLFLAFSQTLMSAIETKLQKSIKILEKEILFSQEASLAKLIILPACLKIPPHLKNTLCLEEIKDYKLSPEKKRTLWAKIQAALA